MVVAAAVVGTVADTAAGTHLHAADAAAVGAVGAVGTAAAGVGTSAGAGAIVASSYPPSSLGGIRKFTETKTTHNNSNNKDDSSAGFHQVVTLAEVGNIESPAELKNFSHENGVFSFVATNAAARLAADTTIEDIVPVVHNLDVADNIPVPYSLPVILSAFNGARVLQEVVDMLPAPLRDFSVDIVVFLLR